MRTKTKFGCCCCEAAEAAATAAAARRTRIEVVGLREGGSKEELAADEREPASAVRDTEIAPPAPVGGLRVSNLIKSPLRKLIEEPSELGRAALVKRVKPVSTAAIAEPALELDNQELSLSKRELERSDHDSPGLSTPTFPEFLVGFSLRSDEELAPEEREHLGGALGSVELVDERASLLLSEEECPPEALMGRVSWRNKKEREALPRDGDELREQLNAPRLELR